MSEIVMVKTPSNQLAPIDQVGVDWLTKLKLGAGARVSIKKARNPAFHRKVFALFNFAFDNWDAPSLEYKGEPVAKEFDQFRKDITILAGHYEAVTNLKGEVRLKAKSLAFSEMDDEVFGKVYQSILGVVWRKVLAQRGYKSENDVERIMSQLMGFE